ncbi:MAG: Bacterioferritin [Gammaproteobacteria bacterium]|nr:Bacterioferritin [Gammaproteobacteria bacterium]
MKGEPAVVSGLNEYLSYELTGHRQYLLHAGMCRHWGFERLAAIQDAYCAEEIRHAAKIIARILLLDGTPAPPDFGAIVGAPTVPEQLALDRALVGRAIAHLRTAIAGCEHSHDFVSRDMLREMLDDEEHHLHWLDTQTVLINQVGLENYLQTQTG